MHAEVHNRRHDPSIPGGQALTTGGPPQLLGQRLVEGGPRVELVGVDLGARVGAET
jgi:hypothetical protein